MPNAKTTALNWNGGWHRFSVTCVHASNTPMNNKRTEHSHISSCTLLCARIMLGLTSKMEMDIPQMHSPGTLGYLNVAQSLQVHTGRKQFMQRYALQMINTQTSTVTDKVNALKVPNYAKLAFPMFSNANVSPACQ